MMMMKWYLNDQGNLVQKWNLVLSANQPVVLRTSCESFSYANGVFAAKDKRKCINRRAKKGTGSLPKQGDSAVLKYIS